MPPPGRAEEIRRRTARLIERFPEYLDAYEAKPPFTRAGQLESHRATIELRRRLGSAEAAVADQNFLQALMGTLAEWGLGVRGSRLVHPERLRVSLRAHASEIAALDGRLIEDPHLDLDQMISELWTLTQELEIVDNEATLVAASKTLHHVLPDLVVPIDRSWTQRFFGWHNPEFQYGQERFLDRAFRTFAEVASAVHPAQYVGGGWRTCSAKVIDNALIGFCIAERIPPIA